MISLQISETDAEGLKAALAFYINRASTDKARAFRKGLAKRIQESMK